MRGGGSSPERRGAATPDLIALAILTALLTLLFADVVTGFNALYIRDLSHAAVPARQMLRETVLGGEFPYWNRWIAGGQPMAANPAHATFYPLTWLILLPDFQLGFQLMVLLHIYIAAWGMYALLRSLRAQPAAAFFGAFSFALGGPLLSILDLLPLLMSFAWLPLICLFARRYLITGSRRDFALAALLFGVQALVGEVSILLQTGIVLGIYSLRHGWRGVLRVGLLSLFALLVGAAQIVPAADHARDSVRARGFAFEQATSWSLPPVRIGELLHPNLLGHQMLNERRVYWGGILYPDRGIPLVHTLYPGMIAISLALAGFIAGLRGRAVVAAIGVTSLLLALGSHTPLWRLLYAWGLARSIRYPEKFILMGTFALTVYGAVALDRLLTGDERLARISRNTVLGVLAGFALVALVALTPQYSTAFIHLWRPPARIAAEMLAASRSGWVVGALRASLLFVLLRNLARMRRPIALALLGALLVLDLGMLLPELTPRVAASFYRDPPRIARALPGNRNEWRLFHIASWETRTRPAYFSPQPDLYWIHRNAMYPMMPATWGIRTVLEPDFDRTELLPTVDFTDAVWDLSRRREDWLPIVSTMSNAWFAAVYVDPAEALPKAGGDPRRVEPVRLIELPHAPRYFFATRLLRARNRKDFVDQIARGEALPATWIAGEPFSPAPGRVRGVRETANSARIEVETAGRSFLVLSVTPHKYWNVKVDGRDAPAIVTNLGYQGLVIESEGRHVVEMRYRNPLIAVGAVLSGLSIAFLAILLRR